MNRPCSPRLRGEWVYQLLDRAETDAVGFTERAVDCAGFGDTHLCTTDERRRVGWIGIAVAYEPLGLRSLVDCRSENPAMSGGIRKFLNQAGLNSSAPPVFRDMQESSAQIGR